MSNWAKRQIHDFASSCRLFVPRYTVHRASVSEHPTPARVHRTNVGYQRINVISNSTSKH